MERPGAGGGGGPRRRVGRGRRPDRAGPGGVEGGGDVLIHYQSPLVDTDGLFMEMKSGQMRTLHYDFKGEAASPEQRQACLKSIIEENRKPEHS